MWIGFGNDGIQCARLQLNEKGVGTLVLNFAPNYPAKAYRVSASDLRNETLLLTLTPIDPDPDGIAVTGTATRFRLDLRIRGTTGSAKGAPASIIALDPYDSVIKAIHAVDARAAGISVSQRTK